MQDQEVQNVAFCRCIAKQQGWNGYTRIRFLLHVLCCLLIFVAMQLFIFFFRQCWRTERSVRLPYSLRITVRNGSKNPNWLIEAALWVTNGHILCYLSILVIDSILVLIPSLYCPWNPLLLWKQPMGRSSFILSRFFPGNLSRCSEHVAAGVTHTSTIYSTWGDEKCKLGDQWEKLSMRDFINSGLAPSRTSTWTWFQYCTVLYCTFEKGLG